MTKQNYKKETILLSDTNISTCSKMGKNIFYHIYRSIINYNFNWVAFFFILRISIKNKCKLCSLLFPIAK